ncbi:hypothetical protein HanXRQr2_Chr11g0486671 [Helianthus annuus]|uniref:Uncharacterized protein n=1 Tax=Helianthus annuus TaxID=4232 RepID=A0A251TB18_HELAN|nr:hypothetical protein HanXRQr2_Chr11g0486671 [Helianthus annuus]KAJ0874823.1 hypothetical protein HanPSC8_Chr11g0468791 [Helianthus annuus]
MTLNKKKDTSTTRMATLHDLAGLKPCGNGSSHFKRSQVMWKSLKPCEKVLSHVETSQAMWKRLKPYEAVWKRLKPC